MEMICEVRPDHDKPIYTIRCAEGETAVFAIDSEGATWFIRFPDTCVCMFPAILYINITDISRMLAV
jgi:hypothetical protein